MNFDNLLMEKKDLVQILWTLLMWQRWYYTSVNTGTSALNEAQEANYDTSCNFGTISTDHLAFQVTSFAVRDPLRMSVVFKMVTFNCEIERR